MSRNGTRDINTVAKDKVPAFMRLLDAMAERLGSLTAAYAKAGVHPGYMHHVRNGTNNLSVTMAQKILAAHKEVKNAPWPHR